MTANSSTDGQDLPPAATEDGPMTGIDITTKGPVRLGLIDGDTVWLSTGDAIRVRAPDLRRLAHQVTQVREEHPGCAVVVDIEVALAQDVHGARAALAKAGDPPTPDTLLYVGTPSGLAGLVGDLHALGMTDGAMLISLVSDGVLELIREQVLPELREPISDTTHDSPPRTV